MENGIIELRSGKQPKSYAPLVSICCTTYQHVKYIADAIDGFLLQQTNFPVEIIIRDDASIDGTSQIVAGYANNYPNLIHPILFKENQCSKGVSPMNDCMSYAKGKYIALCEGDDYWTDPLKLQKQVDFMEKNREYSMVCHDALVKNYMTGTSKFFFSSEHEKKICSTRDVFGVHFCPTASILFRKEALKLNEFYPKALAGDMMLVLLLSLKGLLYRMGEVMSVYRKLETGATQLNRSNYEKSWVNRIEMFNHFDKVSDFKYHKYCRIENEITKNRMRYLNSKSRSKILLLKLYMKILLAKRKWIFR